MSMELMNPNPFAPMLKRVELMTPFLYDSALSKLMDWLLLTFCGVGENSMYTFQVVAIPTLRKLFVHLVNLFIIVNTAAIGHFFNAAYLGTLSFFNYPYKYAGGTL